MTDSIYTIENLLNEIDKKDTVQRDRGTLFEKISKVYLKNEPRFKQKFSDVWLLNEVPGEYNIPKKDTGVDLVAREALTGELVAVQAKYYSSESTIQKGIIDSFLNELGKKYYDSGIIISSSNNWSSNAEDALKDRNKPITRISFHDLANSSIDWTKYSPSSQNNLAPLKPRKTPRNHQKSAIDSVLEGFQERDRGKLIMAPGTGKTYTSLKIAESLAMKKDGQFRVLYLVPSIQLLSQSLRGWTGDSIYTSDMETIAVCSDRSVTRKQNQDLDISITDIGYPATTNTEKLLDYQNKIEASNQEKKILVVFSTYQSIDVVSKAQKDGFYDFDLVIADEAHRTTGATKAGEEASAFVKVHDNNVIKTTKRLYQTATPRVYGESAKAKADEMSVIIADMDDKNTFGPEFFRLGFGEAVHRGILTDYKVMVLAVDEAMVQKEMQKVLSNDENELEFNDVTKIIGCWNGLLKRKSNSDILYGQPMKRAIAFTDTINNSKLITQMWQRVVDEYLNQDDDNFYNVEIDHADGSMNALAKNEKIDWLKSNVPDKTSRILSNVRFLTEGVDVPDLDAVMFLNPRKSKIDIAQAVGRVMRKAPGKDYGYVILPIGVPSGESANEVLDKNERYSVVWDVLNALRSIDERFDATINKLELNKKKPKQIKVIGVSGGAPQVNEDGTDYVVDDENEQLSLDLSEDWSEIENAIYGKIVEKVGNTRYWEQWSKNVSDLAKQHITRIHAMIESEPATNKEFNIFIKGLRHNINDSISVNEAVEMLAQHMITKPVFDALFEEEAFALNNPVSKAMDTMIKELESFGLNNNQDELSGFYESVSIRAQNIDNLEAKQTIIKDLYEKFFKVGFPNTTDKMGIVFTPIEIVDFILKSVEEMLRKYLNKSLNDKGVNILDPFTGTGTFITRLLQSNIINKENLLYKYTNEIYANEMILLSYYIATINIEQTLKETMQINDYVPFGGIVLTDTFEITEEEDVIDSDMFSENNERLDHQRKMPVTVVIGNPPYNMGNMSGTNDEEIETRHPQLEKRISDTYVKNSPSGAQNTLYDKYIKAFRWASDKIGSKGIIGFVTNGSYIDGITASGLRKSWYEEFNYIYVFNLRGNQRTKGEESRKEGGKIFGSGSRASIAITFLIKDGTDMHEIFYHDIGDYLSRIEKLEIVKEFNSVNNINWKSITPDKNHDWINLRDDSYQNFKPILGEIFIDKSLGIETGADPWLVKFSQKQLIENINKLEINFEYERNRLKNVSSWSEKKKLLSKDKTFIRWNKKIKKMIEKNKTLSINSNVQNIMYRPFTKKWVTTDVSVIDAPGKLLKKWGQNNLCIFILGKGTTRKFSAFITNTIPDRHLENNGQAFYFMDNSNENKNSLIPTETNINSEFATKLGLTEVETIYYVYAILHSKEFTEKYSNDLNKDLPRIPVVKNVSEFVRIGNKLADLHLNYEKIDSPGELEIIYKRENPSFKIKKMKHLKLRNTNGKSVDDLSSVVFNEDILIRNIPLKAYEYLINGSSAIEWIMDQYQVKTDTDSGIVDDPNEYSEDPKYIFNLLLSIISVSVETIDLIKELPPLEVIE